MHAARRQEARLRRLAPVAGVLVACRHRGRKFVLLAGPGWQVRSFRIGDITTGAFTLVGGGASEGQVAGLSRCIRASGPRGVRSKDKAYDGRISPEWPACLHLRSVPCILVGKSKFFGRVCPFRSLHFPRVGVGLKA